MIRKAHKIYMFKNNPPDYAKQAVRDYIRKQRLSWRIARRLGMKKGRRNL